MAQRLRQCVQMCATYRPAADLEQQVFAAISAKKQASLRQPPNLLQLGYAFNRIIEQRRLATTRKTNVELLNECIKVHQKMEKVARAKLTTDEIRGLKILSKQSNHFKQILASIWGTDKLQYTAVPLDLISSPFLDLATELPIDKKLNPTWYGLLTKTVEKM